MTSVAIVVPASAPHVRALSEFRVIRILISVLGGIASPVLIPSERRGTIKDRGRVAEDADVPAMMLVLLCALPPVAIVVLNESINSI